MNEFFCGVYRIVRNIPCGKVATYGQIAKILGRPRAAKVVGWAMRHCPDDAPWQRVVKADGAVTGGSFAIVRRARLEAEGVPFTDDGKVDLKKCLWNGIMTD